MYINKAKINQWRKRLKRNPYAKAFSIYCLSMVFMTLLIDAFDQSRQRTAPVSETTIVRLSEPMAEVELDSTQDVTGLKGLWLERESAMEARQERRTERRKAIPPPPSVPVKYAADLTEAERQEIRNHITGIAKGYLGTRYVWGGKTPRGFDCSGFTRYVMKQFEIGLSGSSRYQARQGKAIELDKAKTGDLVFFSRNGKGGRVTHVALVVSNGSEGLHVIHATSRGIVIDNIEESSYWMPKLLYARNIIDAGAQKG